MRRQLAELLPTFAAVYHLPPSEVDDLTQREALEFIGQLPRFVPTES